VASLHKFFIWLYGPFRICFLFLEIGVWMFYHIPLHVTHDQFSLVSHDCFLVFFSARE
jgi:hypothetical protein